MPSISIVVPTAEVFRRHGELHALMARDGLHFSLLARAITALTLERQMQQADLTFAHVQATLRHHCELLQVLRGVDAGQVDRHLDALHDLYRDFEAAYRALKLEHALLQPTALEPMRLVEGGIAILHDQLHPSRWNPMHERP